MSTGSWSMSFFGSIQQRLKTVRKHTSLCVELLESRELLSGTWTPLTNQPLTNIGTMELLSDGTVIGTNAAGSSSPAWFKLTPDASGSHLTGT